MNGTHRTRALEAHMVAGTREQKALFTQRFFRTGVGEYGEGDQFLGYTVPETRRLAREHRDLTSDELVALLASPWHEVRLLALVVATEQAKRVKTESEREAWAEWTLTNRAGINNWDLVDVSIPVLLGSVSPTAAWQKRYAALLTSERLWDRRMAILATFGWMRQGECAPTFAYAEQLLEDTEDLMHKAVGWMLREAGKRDEPALRAFLKRYTPVMPRAMLRYSIERFSAEERAAYLRLPRVSKRRT